MNGQPDYADCGNPDHPEGAWHPAAPVPGPRAFREALAQRLRRRIYGCGCPTRGDLTLLLGRTLLATTSVPDGAPLLDRGTTTGPPGTDLIVRSIVVVPPWRVRPVVRYYRIGDRYRRRIVRPTRLRTPLPTRALVLARLPRAVDPS